MSHAQPWTVGVISDTHGLLRPEALRALQGSDLLIHAGDIGKPEILAELEKIAPVTVVRGNVDSGELRKLPATAVLEVGEISIYILHDLGELDISPTAGKFHAVISGHSHQPSIQWRDDVLYFNPGSAGLRRFKLPVTVGRLQIFDGKIEAEIIPLL